MAGVSGIKIFYDKRGSLLILREVFFMLILLARPSISKDGRDGRLEALLGGCMHIARPTSLFSFLASSP